MRVSILRDLARCVTKQTSTHTHTHTHTHVHIRILCARLYLGMPAMKRLERLFAACLMFSFVDVA